MNVNYEQTGATVLVTDSNNKISELENVDNIRELLILNNERAASKELLRLAKNQLSFEKEKRVHEKHQAYIEFFVDTILAITTAGLFYNESTRYLGTFIGVYYGTKLLFSEGTRFDRLENAENDYNACWEAVRSLSIFDKALSDEYNYELSRSNKVNKIEEKKTLSSDCLVDEDILVYFFENLDRLQDQYDNNGILYIPKFDERNNRILNNMMKYRQESIKDNENNNNKKKIFKKAK